jgi:hypothetical protein
MPAQVRSAAGSNSGTTASTTMTAAMPAGFVANDLLVSIAFSALTAAPSARTGGATALRNIADAAFNADVVWKKAVGGDSFTWTVTSRKWAVVTVAIVAGTWDAVSPSPFHVENGVNFTSATASGTLTTPAVTVSADDTLLLAAFGNAGASTYTVPAQTPPMTLGAQSTSSGTSPASAALIHSALNAVAQGSISRTATASVASVNACMWIGAINPSTTPTQTKFRGVPVGTRRQTAVNSAANW